MGDLLKGARDLVTGLGKSRRETGKKLRKDLAGGKADRTSAVKEMRGDFRNSQAAVRGAVGEARAAWQELGRGKPAKKSALKVAAPGAVMAEAGEVVPAEESPDLEAKLLAAITEHPQGITLTEVAEGLGVVPVVLGRASRKLLDKRQNPQGKQGLLPTGRQVRLS